MAITPPTHWKEPYYDTGPKYDKIIEIINRAQSPRITPYLALETINTRKALLVFHDVFTGSHYNNQEKPMFWRIDGDSDGPEDADDFFYVNVTNGYLHWKSTADIIETKMHISGLPLGGQIVIELVNFNYNDIVSNDKFIFFVYGLVYDSSTATVAQKLIFSFLGEHNNYYHYPGGTKTSTGWGDPDTFGDHTLKFFINADVYSASGKRAYYRIECTGKTAVTGNRSDVFDDDADDFLGFTWFFCSPTLSADWDIEAMLDEIKIYVRDNDDL